ncbi:MAG: SpoIIE family protein phosphatase [Dactylosporangium sp.]|nr:SpoIIE family protein phosphatase [Dactylosporangium sp.]NNJ60888.1 SpoIIE family protein phosphatase [Dactylosporangium sp.]
MRFDPCPGRRLLLVVSVACALLISAGTVMACLSFQQAKLRVITASETSCMMVAAEVYGDRLSLIRLLQALASDPTIRRGDIEAIRSRLVAVGGEAFGFTGGFAWIDADGTVQASTKGVEGYPADTPWWGETVTTRQWTTSAALVDPAFVGEVLVFAVPTVTEAGVVNGVLAAGLGVAWLRDQAAEQARRFGSGRYGPGTDFLLVDRAGQVIVGPELSGTRDLSGSATYRRIATDRHRASYGTLVRFPGLDSRPDRIISYAGTGSFGETIILEGPASQAFAAANQTLAQQFIAMLLLSAIAILSTSAVGRRLDRLARERDELHRAEHGVVVALQRSLLSSPLPNGASARYLPASSVLNVGGDWYDAIRIDGDRLLLVVGDVVGHGVPAALAMGQVRTATRALAGRLAGPADLLTELDAYVAGMEDVIFCTAVCVEIDLTASQMRHAAAGHPPVLVRQSDGAVTVLKNAGGMPLGLSPGPRDETHLPLADGSVLVLYTDGLIERRNELIDDGIARLAAAVSANRPISGDRCDAVIAEALDGTTPSDDIVLLSFAVESSRRSPDRGAPPHPSSVDP